MSQPTSGVGRLGATTASRLRASVPPSLFATIVAVFSIGLILYLPLENAIWVGLTGPAYWSVRLLPDAFICVLAALTLIHAFRAPSKLAWLLLVVSVVSLVIVGVDTVRGHSPVDSINAVRLVLRYAVLGIVLAIWIPDPRGLSDILIATVVIAGATQVVIGLIQVVPTAIAALSSTGVADLGSALVVAGTTGRYDRFGLELAALLLALLALAAYRPKPWYLALAIPALVLLFWSTSRQAMLAVAAASLLVVVWPRVRTQARGIAGGLAALCLVFLVATSSQASSGLGGEETVPGSASGGTVTPDGVVVKGSSELSIDPNRNFRLYLNLVLAPWAATEDPLFGLGPGRHDIIDADPRLVAKVMSDGMDWAFARQFMNDSNFTSLALQFGAIASAAFLGLLLVLIARAGLGSIRYPNPTALFATIFGVALLVAAAFGPSFEIRPISAILWLSLFLVATANPESVQADSRVVGS